MSLFVLIDYGDKFIDVNDETGFFSHLFRDRLRRALENIAPAARQRPAAVRALLNEQDLLAWIEDGAPHGNFGGHVAAVQRDNGTHLRNVATADQAD